MLVVQRQSLAEGLGAEIGKTIIPPAAVRACCFVLTQVGSGTQIKHPGFADKLFY